MLGILMKLCCLLSTAWLLAAGQACASDAIAWRAAAEVSRTPDPCLSWADIDDSRCPEPQSSVLIQGSQPFPSLLLQTSASGGLAWMEPDGSIRPLLSGQRHMAQAMAARQLADGSTLLMTVDLVAQGAPGRSRPHVSLVGADGQLRWTVPLGGFLAMQDRDSLSGAVFEATPAGDLYAVVNGDEMRMVRLRRGDGRVQASRRWLAGSAPQAKAQPDQSAGVYTSRPFAAWLGPSGLHVVTLQGWLRMDADLQSPAYTSWTDRLGSSIVVRAFQPQPASDDVYLVSEGPGTGPAMSACHLTRLPATGGSTWQMFINGCSAERVLDRSGAGQLAFAGTRDGAGPTLFVADETTGALALALPLPNRAVRLAATATRVAYLAPPVEVGLARVRGIEIDTGAQVFQHDFPMALNYVGPTLPDALLPQLGSNGSDTFVLHQGLYSPESPAVFAANVIDANTGALGADIVPAAMAVPTETYVLAHTPAGVLQVTRDLNATPPARKLVLHATTSGAVLWERTIDSTWGRVAVPAVQANALYTLLFQELTLGGTPRQRRVRLQLIDNATGADVYIDERDLEDSTPSQATLMFVLTADGHVVYMIGNRMLTFSPAGQLVRDQTRTDVGFAGSSDGGRIVASDGSELFLLDPVDGSLRTLGPIGPQYPFLQLDTGGGSEDLWTLTRSRVGENYRHVVTQRRPGSGVVWTQSIDVQTTGIVHVFATAKPAGGDLVLELRTSINETLNHQRRLVRLRGTDGAIRWERTQKLAAGVSTGCRKLMPLSDGDLLCIDTQTRTAATTTLLGEDPILAFVRRFDGDSGNQLGVHWISIESEAMRAALVGEGLATRSYTVADTQGFSYMGPVPGARALSFTEIGAIRVPATSASGDVALVVHTSRDGFRMEIHNPSTMAADAVRWGIDASENGALDSFDCSGGMLAGADLRPHAARGSVNIAAGSSAYCEVRWLASAPIALRNALVFAQPDYDFLDTDAGNNLVHSVGDRVYAHGFE